MPERIDLGKEPSSPEERRELISRHIEEQELLAQVQVSLVQRRVIDLLIGGRGYALGDIAVDRSFHVELAGCSFSVRADLAVSIDDRVMLISRCIISTLDSWERYALAFSRVAAPYQIPLSTVTDGETVILIDSLSGQVQQGTMQLLPSRSDLAALAALVAPVPYPAERADREKRILYAFDAIRCPAEPAT